MVDVFFFQAEDGIRDIGVTGVQDVCSSDLNAVLQPRRRVTTSPVWADPRSLATTGGIIVYFLFLGVLRCFSSPGLLSLSNKEWHAFSMPGCPIRKSTDQGSFAPTRGLSQLITSFIASVSLGIHHSLFLTF